MKPSLDFSNPNNTCLSLRTIAELCRRGECRVSTVTDTYVELGIITITFEFPKEAAAARRKSA